MNGWVNRLLCWHRYKLIVRKSGFYGEAGLYRCKKCGANAVKSSGYPEFNKPSETSFTYYE